MITKIHLRNVKGITGSFELGKVTNIYGPNGSGKSAILEGLKIGLTGYTDLGKLPGKTFQLASDQTMSITLESDDGQTLERRFERSGSGAKQTISLNGEPVKEAELHLPGSMCFPVEAIHPGEFLALSGDKRADYVFSNLPQSISAIDPADMPEIGILDKPMPFNTLVSALKDKLSDTEKEIKRCTANVQKLTGELSETPAGNLNEWQERKTADQTELEKLLSEAARNQERASLAKNKNDQRLRLEKMVGEAEEKIKSASKRVELWQRQIKPVEAVDAGTLEKISTEVVNLGNLKRDLERENADISKKLDVFTQSGQCPFCAAKATDLGDRLDEWELRRFNNTTQIQEITQKLDALKGKLEACKAAIEAETNNRELTLKIKVENDALKSYKKFLAERQDELKSLDADSAELPITSPHIIDGQIAGLRSRIEEATKAIEKFISLKALRGKKSESIEENSSLQKLRETLQENIESVKELRDRRLKNATAAIREPFQKIVKSAFCCDAFVSFARGDKPCFDFGVVRAGREVGFDTLSGGEKTILLTALVAAIQKAKAKCIGIGLFELAEADHTSVDGLIKAASDIGFEQLIIASCHGSAMPADGVINIGLEVGKA